MHSEYFRTDVTERGRYSAVVTETIPLKLRLERHDS